MHLYTKQSFIIGYYTYKPHWKKCKTSK